MGLRWTGPHLLVPRRTTSADENIAIGMNFATVLAAQFYLNNVVAQTDAGDTLDVYLDTRYDFRSEDTPHDASTWRAFVRFTQLAGNATEPIQHVALWVGTILPITDLQAITTTLGAADVLHGPVSPVIRARADITQTNDADFDWSLSAYVLEDI